MRVRLFISCLFSRPTCRTGKTLFCYACSYIWLTPTSPAVLTWVSIYWFSRAGPAASMRIYRESVYPKRESVDPDRGTVYLNREIPPDPANAPTIPMGMSQFPKDIYVYPKS